MLATTSYQAARVGRAVPSAPQTRLGALDYYIRNCRFFVQIPRERVHSTSPPGPLSIRWRGGTGVRRQRTHHLSPWPPLHPMERGNGGEVCQLVLGSAAPAIQT